jgi:hypothetical protein
MAGGMTGRQCACPELDGRITHLKATCTDPLVARFGLHGEPAAPQPKAVVHQCPPEGYGIMPCCGRTPPEVPRSDRVTLDPSAVTCPAAQVAAERERCARLAEQRADEMPDGAGAPVLREFAALLRRQ